jgi:hypothetical protein
VTLKIIIKIENSQAYLPTKYPYTMAQVRGVLRCGKIEHCTHTCITRFGSTTGLPVPVANPTHVQSTLFWYPMVWAT